LGLIPGLQKEREMKHIKEISPMEEMKKRSEIAQHAKDNKIPSHQ
jgi:hypothetical protein